ncbi:MAG: 50S ribosomal protein L3 [Armatimonadota bacterium]|nr:50S ribosomal protein L3 [bacterium]
MINGILGKKLGMTQIFDEKGHLVPVTVIEAGPCVVTQIKTEEHDGYEAVQVAFGEIKEKKVNKPLKGHFVKADAAPKRHLHEIEVDDLAEVTVGQEIKADAFERGDVVKVTGVSKGKGFAGAVKRYHFHGADMTHGSMIHRKPQSGGATDAARTFKGSRRPGRMGGKQITQRGLSVFRVDAFRNLILIEGAVPGANGGLVFIRRQMVGG